MTKTSADTPEALPALRALGAFEHIFWLIDHEITVHFALTAHVAGHVAEADWRKALDCVQKRHPLLSVRIEGPPGSMPRFHHVADAPIPLRVVEGDPESGWEDEVAAELALPFDVGQAPLVRAVLIQGPRGAAFTLVAHHSIADGMSIAYAIRDTLQALGGVALEPLPVPPTLDEFLGLGPAVADPEETGHVPSGVSFESASPRTSGARPKVESLRLPADWTAKLRDRARKEGTTVHGALCAALIIAGREVWAAWQEIPVRVLSPFDARDIVGAGESCVDCSGSVIVSFDATVGNFWDLARLTRNRIVAAKNREPLAAATFGLRQALGSGMEVASAMRLALHGFGHEALLTNLGVLPFPSDFGTLKLEALWGPMVLAGVGIEGSQTISVTGFNGALHLVHSARSTPTPPEGLLEAMRDAMEQACAS